MAASGWPVTVTAFLAAQAQAEPGGLPVTVGPGTRAVGPLGPAGSRSRFFSGLSKCSAPPRAGPGPTVQVHDSVTAGQAQPAQPHCQAEAEAHWQAEAASVRVSLRLAADSGRLRLAAARAGIGGHTGSQRDQRRGHAGMPVALALIVISAFLGTRDNVKIPCPGRGGHASYPGYYY